MSCDLWPIRFDDECQEDLSGCGVHVDSDYNVLWSYSAKQNSMACYNPVANNMEGTGMCQLTLSAR